MGDVAGGMRVNEKSCRLRGMSSQTAELLDAFEALAPDEKRVFIAEFLRRAVPFDSGTLEDEETAHATDSLFALLDAEENDAGTR